MKAGERRVGAGGVNLRLREGAQRWAERQTGPGFSPSPPPHAAAPDTHVGTAHPLPVSTGITTLEI